MADAPAQTPLGNTSAKVGSWSIDSSSMGFPTTTAEQTAILSGKPAEEKPAAKVGEKPAAAEEEVAAAEGEEVEAAAEGDDEKPAADAKADEDKPKPKIAKRSMDGRFADKKVKLDWATKELHRVTAEIEAKKAELAGTKPAEKPAEKVDETPAALPEKPTWAKFEADGKSYDDYLNARDEYVAADALAKFEAKQAERDKDTGEKQRAEQRAKAQQQVQEQHQARMEKARESYPDFDAVVSIDVEVPKFVEALMFRSEQGPDLMYAVGKESGIAEALADFQPSRPAFEALLDSENLVDVLEHLASHPAEQARIARMTPVAQVKAIGRLEVELAGADDGSPPAPKPQSKAKPPIQPVVPGPRAAAKDDSDTYTDANADFAKYYRKSLTKKPPVRVR